LAKLKISALSLGFVLLSVLAAQAEPLKAVIFDVEVVESQLEAPSGIPAERLKRVSVLLRDLLAKSGAVTVLDTAPVAADIEKNLPLRTCNDCDLGIAKKLGADIEVTTVLQQTSPVLLSFSASMRDVKTGKVLSSGVVDVRGNSDETWAHGIKFLVRERLLDKPLPESAAALRMLMDK
jgi:hypothetical protein